MAGKESVAIKQKKKKWFHLIAPKQFNEVVVGDTPAYELDSLLGKTITTSLMNLTRDMKKQNINVRLKVVDIKDNKAHTELDEFELNPSSIKRLVRRKKDRIDDSFVVLLKDGKKVRVKPLILTKSNSFKSINTKIRFLTKIFFVEKIKEMTFGEFVDFIVTDRYSRDLKKFLDKVYPVKFCTLRAFQIETSEGVKSFHASEKDLAKYEDYKKSLERKSSKSDDSSEETDEPVLKKAESHSEEVVKAEE